VRQPLRWVSDVGASAVEPDMIPRAHRIGELMLTSLAELMKAAGLRHPAPVEDPFDIVGPPKEAARAKA
jgi:hypothetical protein